MNTLEMIEKHHINLHWTLFKDAYDVTAKMWFSIKDPVTGKSKPIMLISGNHKNTDEAVNDLMKQYDKIVTPT